MSSLGFGITNFNKLQALPLNRERRTYLVRSTESVEPIACLCVRPKASNLSLSIAFDRKRRTYRLALRSTESVEPILYVRPKGSNLSCTFDRKRRTNCPSQPGRCGSRVTTLLLGRRAHCVSRDARIDTRFKCLPKRLLNTTIFAGVKTQ